MNLSNFSVDFKPIDSLDVNIGAASKSSGIDPSGTIEITENGTHNVREYRYADVDIPTGQPRTSDDITVSGPNVTVPAGLYSQQAQKTVGPARTSSDLTVDGATVKAPTGYYVNEASKSVASGTAGTPTATKGTVANNQVSVTPSVNNTTGYITGGTKTGTAVTVKASDLVSGTLNIDTNGEKDVTNYQKVNVNVQGGGGGKNIQTDCRLVSVAKTALSESGLKITCNKSGTYKISWAAARSSSTGTMSTRLYIGTTAKDTDRTTWTNTYGQQITINNFALNAGDVVNVYARSGSTSRYCMVMNLVIEEQ